jgi:hypothetical protein
MDCFFKKKNCKPPTLAAAFSDHCKLITTAIVLFISMFFSLNARVKSCYKIQIGPITTRSKLIFFTMCV